MSIPALNLGLPPPLNEGTGTGIFGYVSALHFHNHAGNSCHVSAVVGTPQGPAFCLGESVCSEVTHHCRFRSGANSFWLINHGPSLERALSMHNGLLRLKHTGNN